MTDDQASRPDDNSKAGRTTSIGIGIAIGVVVGIVLLTITGDAFWIPIGMMLGIVFSAAWPRGGGK